MKKKIYFACMVALIAASSLAVKAIGQEANKTDKNADLEKVLWDADQQWLCNFPNSPYYKEGLACTEFRRNLWSAQFFEISDRGTIQTKAQMIAQQSVPNRNRMQTFPSEFKLMAVYGDIALATDRTLEKTVDAAGNPVSRDVRVLRMFVKEGGKWRPAGGALVPIVGQ